jgi:hypothetical protein
MSTRIYLPSSGAAPVTPSTWNFANQINPLTFKGVLTKILSAMTTKLEATGTTSPIAKAMLRYVIGPLGAQSISGTVHLQMRAMESNALANATFAIAVKIIKPDGTDRAVLLAQTASDLASSPYELLTVLTNRRVYNVSEVQPIPLTTQSAIAGDYLVIEIGFRSATTTSRNISLRYGDNSASDMEDDTTSVNDYAPWVEFSQTLTWPEAHSGSVAIHGNGSLTGTATKGGRGSVLKSGGGALLALGLAGMLGVAGISGGGSQVAVGRKDAVANVAISGGGSLAATGQAAETHFGSAVISGNGALAAAGNKSARASPAISGAGVLASDGRKAVAGVAGISGDGGLTASGVMAASSTASLSGGGLVIPEGRKGASDAGSISEGGVLIGIGTKQGLGDSVLSGSGVLAAAGYKSEGEARFGTAIVSGGGHVAGDGEKSASSGPSISGAGSPMGLGIKAVEGSAALSRKGDLAGIGMSQRAGLSIIAGGGSVIAAGALVKPERAKVTLKSRITRRIKLSSGLTSRITRRSGKEK